jgi:hypothetical protein
VVGVKRFGAALASAARRLHIGGEHAAADGCAIAHACTAVIGGEHAATNGCAIAQAPAAFARPMVWPLADWCVVCGWHPPRILWFALSGTLGNVVQLVLDRLLARGLPHEWWAPTACWFASYAASVVLRHKVWTPLTRAHAR